MNSLIYSVLEQSHIKFGTFLRTKAMISVASPLSAFPVCFIHLYSSKTYFKATNYLRNDNDNDNDNDNNNNNDKMIIMIVIIIVIIIMITIILRISFHFCEVCVKKVRRNYETTMVKLLAR